MLRLLDEAMDLGERGVALIWLQTPGETVPHEGMKLRDARGRVHEVTAVTREQHVYTLLLPGGDAAYFERLFRNVLVDARVFEEVE